jgi:P63C domain
MTEGVAQALYGSQDNPLRIGDLTIPCYVLEGERRVLVQRGIVSALGMARGSSANTGGDRLAKFTAGKALSPYVSADLLAVTANPIKFRTPNGNVAYGYEATILADICEAVLQARADGKLQKQQEHIAKQCEILVRGFARVGIIALVDEATGYQEVRARRALEKILERFISDELLKWAKMFPDEFYEQMARLRGLHYSEIATKRPPYIGRLTNDIVYERLAPGVLEELKRKTPRDDKGRRKHKHFQYLTEDIGNPRLREHLWAVIGLMRASSNWRNFYSLLNRAFPKYTDHPQLFIDYEENEAS